MKTVNYKVASFMEAFQKFISYADDSVGIDCLFSFSKLKQDKKIEYSSKKTDDYGGRNESWNRVEMFYITKPTTFYVVKLHKLNTVSNDLNRTETFIFVS